MVRWHGQTKKTTRRTAAAKAVRARLKDKDLEGWQLQKLQAVQLGLAMRLSLPQIAEAVGISPRSVGVWFELFRLGGLEGLLMLMSAINAVLAEYWTTPAKVRSLTGDGWRLDTANAPYPSVLAV